MLRWGRTGLWAQFPFSKLVPSLVLVAEWLEMVWLGRRGVHSTGFSAGAGRNGDVWQLWVWVPPSGCSEQGAAHEGSFIGAVLGAGSCLGEDFGR